MAKIKIDPSKLDFISSCMICQSNDLEIILEGVKDDVGNISNFQGNVYRCKKCSHAFLSPVIKASLLHLAYDGYHTHSSQNLTLASSAKRDLFSIFKDYYLFRYQKLASLKGRFIYFLSKLIPFLSFFLSRAVRFIKIPENNKHPNLLDIGCGRGDFLLRAQYCGYKTTGIDFDPITIEIARSRHLDVHVLEVGDLPESIKYDVITLNHVIEHVLDPLILIKNIFSRLKKGGYLYIATPNFDCAGRLTFDNHWRGCDIPRHMQFFNIKVLIMILKKAGFSKIKQVYDLPQSRGIVQASFNLKYPNGYSITQLLSSIKLLFLNKFYSKDYLEVAVFKCYR